MRNFSEGEMNRRQRKIGQTLEAKEIEIAFLYTGGSSLNLIDTAAKRGIESVVIAPSGSRRRFRRQRDLARAPCGDVGRARAVNEGEAHSRAIASLLRPKDELEHTPTGLAAIGLTRGWIFGNASRPLLERSHVKPHVAHAARADLDGDRMEGLCRALGVPLYTLDVAYTRFDACGRQVDEPLEEERRRAPATACFPESFPDLVRLPIEAVIEEVDSVEIRTAIAPSLWIWPLDRLRGDAETVPEGIAHGVRASARDIGVRRQRSLTCKTRRSPSDSRARPCR